MSGGVRWWWGWDGSPNVRPALASPLADLPLSPLLPLYSVQAGGEVTVYYNPNNGELPGREQIWIRWVGAGQAAAGRADGPQHPTRPVPRPR